jgi:hypothetical protein
LFCEAHRDVEATSRRPEIHLCLCHDACRNSFRPASDATADEVRHLAEVLMVDATVEMVREDGIDSGSDLVAQSRSDSSSEHWQQQIEPIYDLARMRQIFIDTLVQQLAHDVDTLRDGLAFYGGDLGQRILTLEFEARRTLRDQAAEEAANLGFAEMQAARDPRVETIYLLSELNDLLESQIVIEMNTNLAFLEGMGEGAPSVEKLDDEQMLAMLWTREDVIRAETEARLYPFLAFSYASLSDDEMRKYIDFSKTRAAKRLNIAISTALERIFTQNARQLGALLGARIRGEDI